MTHEPNQPELLQSSSHSQITKIECLGETFENDNARREYYLERLRNALEELHRELGGVPFTAIDHSISHLENIENWPMGEPERLKELAERMRDAARGSGRGKDLLQLWKDEVGFPHGEIEDILRLSDPPYYTACPNPFIREFVSYYARPYDPSTVDYRREPFAVDVSEGKSDVVYNAHGYHTKVPHKAIMRYILHYTSPGDVILDGFAGTGMTGVASQLCGSRSAVEDLGYHVQLNGEVFDPVSQSTVSKVGMRRAILVDISSAAAFISYNYSYPPELSDYEIETRDILQKTKYECGWMFLTLHKPNNDQLTQALLLIPEISQHRKQLVGLQFGEIHYVIWSDVFLCPECGSEFTFWDVGVDESKGTIRDQFKCPNCSVILTRRQLDRAWATEYDSLLGQQVELAKQLPVRINYTVGSETFFKKPDEFDLALLKRIGGTTIPHWVPTNELEAGDKTGDPFSVGIRHSHQFYTKRNLWILASIFAKSTTSYQKWLLTSILQRGSKQHQIAISRIGGPKAGEGGATAGHRRGTLYIPSNQVEYHPIHLLEGRIHSGKEAFKKLHKRNTSNVISTQSTATLSIGDNEVDYIFVDPPFGGNIMYSELNFGWEAWLKAFTNNTSEAVQNKSQNKDLLAYQHLMSVCFREFFRVLKPGRWMTVEFHNSQNSVWNAIQESLQNAGFVVADVSSLDKKIKTHTQRTAAGSVNQDLVISAYKPNGGLEERFRIEAGTENGVWDFVRTHLKQLPVFVSKDGQVEIITERQNYLLFDRMVAFHVQRGVSVPLSASEFYSGLEQRFAERDDMYFLPEQVAEYDRKRLTAKEVIQLTLFVTDEDSAIQWLKQQLTKKPQSFQDLHPQFMKQIGGWNKHEISLELRDLLEQNFLVYDGIGEVPGPIHSYLSSNYKDMRNLAKDNPLLRSEAKDRWYVPDPNRAGDLEKLRERALLREFQEYRESKSRKLKVFRLEAVRVGFKKAWSERDYATILAVAEKIPDAVLQEDPKLLMWYDQALTRMGK